MIIFWYKIKVLFNLFSVIKLEKKTCRGKKTSYVCKLPIEGYGDVVSYNQGSEFLTLIVRPEFFYDHFFCKQLEKSLTVLSKKESWPQS